MVWKWGQRLLISSMLSINEQIEIPQKTMDIDSVCVVKYKKTAILRVPLLNFDLLAIMKPLIDR